MTLPASPGAWPISLDDIRAAAVRIAPFLTATPLRHYAELDHAVGNGIRVLVKHENHLPTNAFKARNGLALITALSADERRRGVVAATRGNHGMGLARAGSLLGVPVTICVPHGNNPEKNAAIRGFGAELVQAGTDYDAAVAAADELVQRRGMVLAHSTNDRRVLAGAGTMAVELVEQAAAQGEQLDALVVAVGGGSQAVGAIIATHELAPTVEVFAVQAAGASATHDSWHAGSVVVHDRSDTIADGLAVRRPYDLTFPAMLAGLRDFVAVSEAALADAVRMMIRTTHNLAEPSGAAGLAGVIALRERLANKTVGIVLSGANIDAATLRDIMVG